MGVASGCGCKEVYRFPHITYPYSSCICSFLQQHPYILFINPLTSIVQKSILPLRDRNRAYMHGFQRIRSNVFLINIKF